jgi:hypothetical protein
VRRGGAEAESAGVEKARRDGRDRRDREGARVRAPLDHGLEREHAHERDPERVGAVKVRPQEDERRDRPQCAAVARARGEAQVEDEREERDREELRPVAPGLLREGQREEHDEDRRGPRCAEPPRDAREEEGGAADQQRAQDHDALPRAGGVRERQDDLAKPFAHAVRLAADRRGEDVLAQERLVLDHPAAARDVPVGVGVARGQAHGERVGRGGDRERSAVAHEPSGHGHLRASSHSLR